MANQFLIFFNDETSEVYNIESTTMDLSYTFNFGGISSPNVNFLVSSQENQDFDGSKVSPITWYIRGTEEDKSLDNFMLKIHTLVSEGKEIQSVSFIYNNEEYVYDIQKIYNINYSNNINGMERVSAIPPYELRVELK